MKETLNLKPSESGSKAGAKDPDAKPKAEKPKPLTKDTLLEMPANGWPALEPAIKPSDPEKPTCQSLGFHVDATMDTDKDSRGQTIKRPYTCSLCGARFDPDDKPILDALWTIRLWKQGGVIDEADAEALVGSWITLYQEIYDAKQTVVARKAAEAEKQRAADEKAAADKEKAKAHSDEKARTEREHGEKSLA